MKSTFFKLAKFLNFVPLSFLIKITQQKFIFPFYHIVSNSEIIHIKHLYKVRTTNDFNRDLDFILKHYSPASFNSSSKSFKSSGNNFFLSFDDGLSEFHDIIAPILLKKGIPAICFLNSDFIDNKDLFFRYKASILIEELLTSKFIKSFEKFIKTWFEANNFDYNNPYSLLKINYKDKHLLDELAVIIEFDFKEYLNTSKPYLDSSQINSLSQKGFLFGAHSMDHPQFSEINLNEQLFEIIESINIVTSSFNIDYKFFSFPFTDHNVSNDFFKKVFEKNVPIADYTFGCAGLKKDSCSKNLQRIPMEVDNFSASEIIYGEYLYYIFKALINKNVIKRI